MDLLITGLLLWVYNLLFPETRLPSNNTDMENGAAFFFGSEDFMNNSESSEKVNNDYDDGPNW